MSVRITNYKSYLKVEIQKMKSNLESPDLCEERKSIIKSTLMYYEREVKRKDRKKIFDRCVDCPIDLNELGI